MDVFAQAAADMAGTDLAVDATYLPPAGATAGGGATRLIVGTFPEDVLDRGVGARSQKAAGFVASSELTFSIQAGGRFVTQTQTWKVEAAERDSERSGFILELTPLSQRGSV